MSLSITKPNIGGDAGSWGSKLNDALDAIVSAINAIDLTTLLPKAGGTMSGRLGVKTAELPRTDLGAGGGVLSIDLNAGQWFTATAAPSPATTTFTIANGPAANKAMGFILRLVNGGAGTVVFPASVKWPGGVAPAFTVAGTDVLVFLSDDAGGTWYATIAVKDGR